MMLLEPKKYYKVEPYLAEIDINHLFVKTVLGQKMSGAVYVDHPDRPETFLVRHDYGVSLLLGNTTNEAFNRQLASYLLNQNHQRTSTEWMQTFPRQWDDILPELLNGRLLNADGKKADPAQKVIVKDTRVNFKFNQDKFTGSGQQLPGHLTVERTTGQMFEEIKGTVVPRYFWRNSDEFIKFGMGYSVMIDNRPVSTCFSAYVHPPQIELGIETHAGYQGKGLARLASQAMIDYCIENSYEPVWACRLSNTGSFHLAQKLGFEPTKMIPYYLLPI